MEDTRLDEMTSDELRSYIYEQQDNSTEVSDTPEPVEPTEPDNTIEYEEPKQETIEEPKQEESIEQETLYKVKADGTEYNFTLDELKIAASKGINYTQKTTALKPYRNMIKAMQDNGVNETDINMLIDIKKGNKEALSKLVKDSQVDVYELPDEVDNYTPTEYRQSDKALDLADMFESIKDDPEFNRTSQVLANLDSQSKQAIGDNPVLVTQLHESIKSGEFDLVFPEAKKLAMLDGGVKPFLQYYYDAGTKLMQSGRLNTANTNNQTTQQTVPVQQQVNPQVTRAKKSASLPSSRADKKSVVDYLDADGNIDTESEEFQKAYEAFSAKLQRKY